MTAKLAGKIALVTGGSSGIGLATAKRFVAEGAQVVVTGRRQAELDQAAAAPPVPVAAPVQVAAPTESGRRPLNTPDPAPLPGMSVQEVFIAARTGLQEWADAEENKPLIVAGDVEGCLRDPWVQQALQAHQGFGPVMAEKLIKHFRFLVDNRRGFYASRGLSLSGFVETHRSESRL